MKFGKMTVLIVFLTLITAGPAWSHFGMLIPSDSMVMQDDDRTVTVTLSFSHPFEMVGMDLVKPKVFNVLAGGKKQDLLGSLEASPGNGPHGLEGGISGKAPGGVHVLYGARTLLGTG